jgi:hypothetical protein
LVFIKSSVTRRDRDRVPVGCSRGGLHWQHFRILRSSALANSTHAYVQVFESVLRKLVGTAFRFVNILFTCFFLRVYRYCVSFRAHIIHLFFSASIQGHGHNHGYFELMKILGPALSLQHLASDGILDCIGGVGIAGEVRRVRHAALLTRGGTTQQRLRKINTNHKRINA